MGFFTSSNVFTYNGYGQLAGTTVNGTVAQYKYNLSGLRVSKTVSGQTTLYFYDNDGRLLSEVDAGTGAVNREYIWLGTKPVAYLAGEQVYLRDHVTPPLSIPIGKVAILTKKEFDF